MIVTVSSHCFSVHSALLTYNKIIAINSSTLSKKSQSLGSWSCLRLPPLEIILFYRLRKRGARRRPSKREGSWQRVRIWNEEEETQKDSREVWERNCRLETCWRCTRKGDYTAMRQFFKSLSSTKMKVETWIRLHCQTASVSATISKHYLPHLSAITTFFLWNTLPKL